MSDKYLTRIDGSTVRLAYNIQEPISLKRQSNLNELSRRRRRKPTPSEKKLLFHVSILCEMLNGVRYKREHVIHFSSQIARIVDLSFPKQKLFIEVDGSSHDSEMSKTKDEWKDRLGREMGWRTLRVSNEECLKDIGSVILRIARSLHSGKNLGRKNHGEIRNIIWKLTGDCKWEAMVGEFLQRRKIKQNAR